MQQRSNENLANFRKDIFEGLRINSVKSEATKIHISMTHSRVKMNSQGSNLTFEFNSQMASTCSGFTSHKRVSTSLGTSVQHKIK